MGAVSTQSCVNPYLAIEALNLMGQGKSGSEALDAVLLSDDARDLRRIVVVDGQGRPAVWSGQSCTQWFCHIVGEHLLLAMETGQAAGGDKRGRQSASMKVFGTEDYALLDLRVDEHTYPVAELRRVYTIAQLQLLPFVEGMPKKGARAGGLSESVARMLMTPPPYRPGGGGSAP